MFFNFTIKPQRDIESIYYALVKPSPQGHILTELKIIPQDLTKKIQNSNFEKAYPLIRPLVDSFYSQSEQQISEKLTKLKSAWLHIEKRVLNYIGNLYKIRLDLKKVDVYLTMLPYQRYHYPDWFQVGFHAKIEKQLKTLVHELLHFGFEKYLVENPSLADEFTLEQLEVLREAITVIINLSPFCDLIQVQDQGHKREAELRTFLLENLKNKASFNIDDISSLAREYFD